MNMTELAGKVALITGSSRGIGMAIAEAFAEEGIKVIINGRSTERVNKVASALNSKRPGIAVPIPADLMDRSEIEMLAREALATCGRVDVLVNNAGIGHFAPVQELEADAWDAVIRTNLDAVYYLTKLLLPQMIERKDGYIINIASLAAKNTFAGGAAYCASKFGLLGFSECLMLDVREFGIKVSVIMPGSVATDFSRPVGSADDWKQRPSDIAQVCVNLLKDRKPFLVSRLEMRPLNPPKK